MLFPLRHCLRRTSSTDTTIYTPEEAAPPATGQNLLPQVDCKVDMKELSLETMIQTFCS